MLARGRGPHGEIRILQPLQQQRRRRSGAFSRAAPTARTESPACPRPAASTAAARRRARPAASRARRAIAARTRQCGSGSMPASTATKALGIDSAAAARIAAARMVGHSSVIRSWRYGEPVGALQLAERRRRPRGGRWDALAGIARRSAPASGSPRSAPSCAQRADCRDGDFQRPTWLDGSSSASSGLAAADPSVGRGRAPRTRACSLPGVASSCSSAGAARWSSTRCSAKRDRPPLADGLIAVRAPPPRSVRRRRSRTSAKSPSLNASASGRDRPASRRRAAIDDTAGALRVLRRHLADRRRRPLRADQAERLRGAAAHERRRVREQRRASDASADGSPTSPSANAAIARTSGSASASSADERGTPARILHASDGERRPAPDARRGIVDEQREVRHG